MPMPAPAPAAPRPMPSASAIALPACTTGALATFDGQETEHCAVLLFAWVRGARSALVLGLDRRADVDGGEGGEDERLDRDDDHDFEDVEDERGREPEEAPGLAVDDEDEADHRQDQDVAGEHVREEPDARG